MAIFDEKVRCKLTNKPNGVKSDEQIFDERKSELKSEYSKHKEKRRAGSAKSKQDVDDKVSDDRDVATK